MLPDIYLSIEIALSISSIAFYRIALLQIELGPYSYNRCNSSDKAMSLSKLFRLRHIFFNCTSAIALLFKKTYLRGITQPLGIVVDSALIIPKILSGNPPELDRH